MMPPASDPYVRALSRSQDRLTSIPVNPNEIQNANLLSRLPGPNDVAGSPISSQSLSAERQDGLDLVVHRITNFLAGLYELPSPSSTWLHLKLSPIERDEVLQCLENNSTFACCRCDYFLATHTLSIGMETKTHAVFATYTAMELMNRITQLKSQHPDSALGHFTEKVAPSGSATIELQMSSTENSHEPDASLLYKGAQFPGIVIEVAHSQPKEALAMLAEEYILGTGGNVTCVVGLKIAYPLGKQVTLSVWELGVDVLAGGQREGKILHTVQDQIIRTAEGLVNPSALGLSLSLYHLAPTTGIADQLKNVPQHLTKIHITAQELCEFLEDAQEADVAGKNGMVRDDELILKRPNMPAPEEVSDDRERQFEEEEKRVVRRGEDQDPDYVQ